VNETSHLQGHASKATHARRPPAKPRPPTLLPFIDPETLENVFCLTVDGACLEPLIPDGSRVVIKRSETFAVNDVVCIWFKRDVIFSGGHRCWVKRLTMKIPHFVKFPFVDAPGSDLSPMVFTEQLNPPQRLAIPCSQVHAVNKVIGYFPAGKVGEGLEMGK